MKHLDKDSSPVKKVAKHLKESNKNLKTVADVPKKRKLSGDFELTEISSNTKKESVNVVSSDLSELYNDRTVYVEGLPFTATDENVKEFFKQCGNISNLRLARWHDTGRLRGYIIFEMNL